MFRLYYIHPVARVYRNQKPSELAKSMQSVQATPATVGNSKLIGAYNAEDCQALRILTEELARLRSHADSQLNVDYVDQPKRNATNLGSERHAAFDHVRLYASVNYPARSWFLSDADAQTEGARSP